MARLTLWLFVIALGLDLGAGLYESRIVVPFWANGVPETLTAGSPNAQVAINAGMKFWAIMTPAVGVLALAALVTGFRVPQPQRTWRTLAAVLELCVVASTLLYFRPTLIRLFMGHGGGMPREAIVASVRLWVTLGWVRVAVSLGAWLAALAAFAHG